MEEISSNEASVLKYLSSGTPDFIREHDITIEDMDERSVSSAVSWLESKGLVECRRETSSTFSLTGEAESYLEHGLPEEKLLNLVRSGKNSMKEIMGDLGAEGRIALAQIAKFGIKPEAGVIKISDYGSITKEIEARKEALYRIRNGEMPDTKLLDHLKSRSGLLTEKKITTRSVRINEKGKAVIAGYDSSGMIDALTPEILLNGSWKGRKFRHYDLGSKVSRLDGAYFHPLTVLINRVREIFFDLGFTEMDGHYIETAAWNMDSLFIPQDHPARELQDTFYIESESPQEIEFPEILEKIGKIHEKGFGKYSGWGYKWSSEEGRKLLLRTHTTVSTARYLYEHNEPPVAAFSVERVFRHESVDWKHLAEFYQIEGTVYSRDANLSTLKWLMGEFYRRLGFNNIRLIPSYYPYTEPSMDVVVKVGNREVELGGSGIFRPEVEKILGLKSHAIAWGLGLERLAFLYYQMNDIRGIYNSDIEWLRTYKISP